MGICIKMFREVSGQSSVEEFTAITLKVPDVQGDLHSGSRVQKSKDADES